MKNVIIFLFITIFLVTKLLSQANDTPVIYQTDSIITVVQDLIEKREYTSALELNAKLEKIIIESLGKESAAYGKCCNNYGRILERTAKDKREAEKWYLEALAVRKKVFGTDHFEYASSLLNLGQIYGQMGNFGKAEPLFLEAKEIFVRQKGNDNAAYARCLNNLGIVKLETRDYEKSEEYYLEAKEIRLRTSGKYNPEYCGNLINLGRLYYNMAYYEKAEEVLLEAMDIFTNQLKNQGHPFYVNALTMLSLLYGKTGEYGKAEPLFLENIERLEKTIGKENDKYAGNLNNLANLYMDLGNYEKAEATFLKALDIKEKLFGKENQFYSTGLQNIGILYGRMGNYQKAENYFLEAIGILGRTSGKDHPEYAEALVNLANIYLGMQQYDKAESNYLLSMEIQRKLSRVDHPDYAALLTNLGKLYQFQNKYDKAEQLQMEAKSIIERNLGKESPDYSTCLSNLAGLFLLKGDYVRSEPFMKELDELNKKNIRSAIQHLSESELQKYLKLFTERQNYLFSLASNIHNDQELEGKGVADISKICFDNSLFYKELLLNVSNQSKRIALADSLAGEKFNLLKSYLRILTSEYSKPLSDRDSAFVVKMEMKANNLEKELAKRSNDYLEASRHNNWEEIQNSLKKDQAVVDFLHYRQFSNNKEFMVYAALVLKPGMSKPYFIPLCDESELDSIFDQKEGQRNHQINSLYSPKNQNSNGSSTVNLILYDLLWRKIDMQISGIKTVYFSPSGLLHRINLQAIPISKNQVLNDKYQLIEMSSFRKLIDGNQKNYKSKDAILFGGIRFDADSSIVSPGPLVVSRSRGEFSFNSVDSSLRVGSWNYLLGTEREVNAIGKILSAGGFKVNLKKGYEGTESSFKEIGMGMNASPRILHLATHGYFFPDGTNSPNSNLPFEINEPVFKISDNPMLRSGLIMAGGNATWLGQQTLKGNEDGILTALEISQMNLSNTELVVLSACETGLGDIQGNEGVYGLQRAFKLAGVKYLIMSLWQVPDKQTSFLMTNFYKKWWKEGNSIPQAFHKAQKELRDIGMDPYHWAGFILIE